MKQTKISQAFRALRKKGYFAKQNFWCCQSCAWADVPKGSDKVVFYHAQDLQDLRKTGDVYIAWSGDGNQIREEFERVGCTVQWDGSQEKRMKIIGAWSD